MNVARALARMLLINFFYIPLYNLLDYMLGLAVNYFGQIHMVSKKTAR